MKRPARSSRKAKQAETRERIKAAARAALETHGIAGFGIEQIARDAGYTRGAFYANFSSKSELLLELLQDRAAEELRFWNVLLEQMSDRDACLAMIIADSQDLSRSRATAKLELQLEAERNEHFRPHYIAHLRLIHAEIRRLVLAILARYGKAPPPNLDVKVAAIYAFGSNLGLGSSLGFRADHRQAAITLMLDYIRSVTDSAPHIRSEVDPVAKDRPSSFDVCPGLGSPVDFQENPEI